MECGAVSDHHLRHHLSRGRMVDSDRTAGVLVKGEYPIALDRQGMQDAAYLSSTTTCRSLLRRAKSLRRRSHSAQRRSMHDPVSELPRIPIPRTWVNKG